MNLSKPLKYGLVLVFLLLTSSFSSSLLAMTNPCNPAYVSIDANGDLLVSPSGGVLGGVDTANLNCAGNAIKNKGFNAVKLENGQYYIKEVMVHCPASKNCIFAGTTKAGTVLNIVDNSIPCNVRSNNHIATGGLSVRGTILVQFLTIRGNSPCSDGGVLPALIVFSGAPAVMTAECDNSILYGNLNRVVLVGVRPGIDAGLLVAPQGLYFEDACPDNLLGSFTSTRTEIEGTEVGVLLSMQSSARVSFDYLTTSNTKVGAGIISANVIAQFNFCNIEGRSFTNRFFWGIAVLRDDGAPNITKTSIYNCTFNVRGPMGTEDAIAITVNDSEPPSRMISVVTSNTFNLQGPRAYGVRYEDISDCTTSANQFKGSASTGISLLSDEAPVSGCTVTANTGFGSFNAVMADIHFGDGTINNIAGSNAGAILIDDGSNFLNDPLPESGQLAYDGRSDVGKSKISRRDTHNSLSSVNSISEFRRLLRMNN